MPDLCALLPAEGLRADETVCAGRELVVEQGHRHCLGDVTEVHPVRAGERLAELAGVHEGSGDLTPNRAGGSDDENGAGFFGGHGHHSWFGLAM